VALFLVHGSSRPEHLGIQNAQCQSFSIKESHCAVQYDRY
jgi:hypothetical protein